MTWPEAIVLSVVSISVFGFLAFVAWMLEKD